MSLFVSVSVTGDTDSWDTIAGWGKEMGHLHSCLKSRTKCLFKFIGGQAAFHQIL